jgi:hypothetical protein
VFAVRELPVDRPWPVRAGVGFDREIGVSGYQGPKYDEDPARGTIGPLWGAVVPDWGRDVVEKASKQGVNCCNVF